MIPDIDIWRAAQLMVKRYGEDAGTEAALRADDLFEAGDTDGAAVWRRILSAVDELLDTATPQDGRKIH